MTQTTAAATRQAIVMAAFACFRNYGLHKTTIVDIVRAADVSRSTFYEYFRDKAAVVEACAEASSQRFYRNMAKAVDRGGSLEDKLCRAAVFVTQARDVVEPEKYFDDQDEVSLLLTKNAATLLQECTDFFAPYLTAAKVTGEVRKDLDVQAAGEWFARMLFSLFTTPSPTVNMHNPDEVAAFVRAHVVRGYTDDRSARIR
jgi:AcrR family transcriptional regulator